MSCRRSTLVMAGVFFCHGVAPVMTYDCLSNNYSTGPVMTGKTPAMTGKHSCHDRKKLLP